MNKAQCSVIIISFNNFDETTGPCLQSLAKDSSDLEIIVVDNNSNQATREALQQAAEKDSRIQLIFNATNRGYAGGNNDGVQCAHSPLLLLLNSDTQVLPQSISTMVRLMNESPQWAMLGPVSNQTGNDQQIYSGGNTVEEIIAEGDEWCKHSKGSHYPTDILSFCCVMIRKYVYRRLKGLDEAFGLGYYEDTDFNYRATKKGLQLIISEEAFIYHRGSGSFSKHSKKVYKMVKRNKALFHRKHGHGIIAAHWRLKNLNCLKRYSDQDPKNSHVESLRYMFRNRLALAEELIPNSPIKKFIYYRKLSTVKKRFLSRFDPHQIDLLNSP